jgi:hypothetical protein
MAFTYTLPTSGVFPTLKDEVRFLVMDTVLSSFSLDDTEIAYLLKQFDDRVYLAASQGALSISVKYSKEASTSSKSVGDLSLTLSYLDSAKEYKTLSEQLRLGKISNDLVAFFEPSEELFTIGQFDENTP